MRGFFGIGIERVSKPMNLGNLYRTAHGFGASFIFTIDADCSVGVAKSDTSRAPEHLPLYRFETPADLALPKGCALVGVELVDEAVDLPSFRHPHRAAYMLGPERGALSAELLARCDLLVRIPTAFCLNVATAGAIVMYDRVRALGRFGERPVAAGGPVAERPPHIHGGPVIRGPVIRGHD